MKERKLGKKKMGKFKRFIKRATAKLIRLFKTWRNEISKRATEGRVEGWW